MAKKNYQVALDDAEREVLIKAFKTLNRFNWIKALQATGFVSSAEGGALKSALQSLGEQIEGASDGE